VLPHQMRIHLPFHHLPLKACLVNPVMVNQSYLAIQPVAFLCQVHLTSAISLLAIAFIFLSAKAFKQS